MSTVKAEFPVGGLLNGGSYKTSTRMNNISAAMTWIQRQLESIRDSDQQLLDLFQKLETDMAELKSIYNDNPRGRTSSISSVRDVYTNYTRASQASIGSMTLPHDLSPNIGHSRTILTPMETLLDHSNSNSSLDDFANELGLDDDDDDYLMNREEEAGQPSNRQSIKSQSSGMSYENDISFALSLPSNHPSVPEEEYHRNSPQRDSYLSSAASEGSPSNEKRSTRRLSNDSGAVADSDSTGSSTACETKEIKQIYDPSMDTLATPTATLKDEEDEGNKRLSGFADEIFAMFKLSN